MSSQVQVSPRYLSNPTGMSPFGDALVNFQERNQQRRDTAQENFFNTFDPIAERNSRTTAMFNAKEQQGIENRANVQSQFDNLNTEYETEIGKLKQDNQYEMPDRATGRIVLTPMAEALKKKYDAQNELLQGQVMTAFNADNGMLDSIYDPKGYGRGVEDQAMKLGLDYEDAQKMGAAEQARFTKPGMTEAEKLAVQEKNKNAREVYKQTVDSQLKLGKTEDSLETGYGTSGSSSGSSSSRSTNGGLYAKALKLVDRGDNQSVWDGVYDYIAGDSKEDISKKVSEIRTLFPNDKQAFAMMEEAIRGSGEGKKLSIEKIKELHDKAVVDGTLLKSGGYGSGSNKKKTSFKGYRDPNAVQNNIEAAKQRLENATNFNVDKYRQKGIKETVFGSEKRDVFGDVKKDFEKKNNPLLKALNSKTTGEVAALKKKGGKEWDKQYNSLSAVDKKRVDAVLAKKDSKTQKPPKSEKVFGKNGTQITNKEIAEENAKIAEEKKKYDEANPSDTLIIKNNGDAPAAPVLTQADRDLFSGKNKKKLSPAEQRRKDSIAGQAASWLRKTFSGDGNINKSSAMRELKNIGVDLGSAAGSVVSMANNGVGFFADAPLGIHNSLTGDNVRNPFNDAAMASERITKKLNMSKGMTEKESDQVDMIRQLLTPVGGVAKVRIASNFEKEAEILMQKYIKEANVKKLTKIEAEKIAAKVKKEVDALSRISKNVAGNKVSNKARDIKKLEMEIAKARDIFTKVKNSGKSKNTKAYKTAKQELDDLVKSRLERLKK